MLGFPFSFLFLCSFYSVGYIWAWRTHNYKRLILTQALSFVNRANNLVFWVLFVIQPAKNSLYSLHFMPGTSIVVISRLIFWIWTFFFFSAFRNLKTPFSPTRVTARAGLYIDISPSTMANFERGPPLVLSRNDKVSNLEGNYLQFWTTTPSQII